MKKALLVVSFGTSVPEAEQAIIHVENKLKEHFSDYIFLRAFTSRMICRRLAGEGRPVLSPEEAFEKLAAEGVDYIVVQPTHIAPGKEYEKLCEIADNYRDTFEAIRIGKPLISSKKDLLDVADIIWKHYETDIQGGEGLVLMGHGTGHIAGMIYGALQTAFRIAGKEPVFIGTVEGWPELTDIVLQLKAGGYQKVHLAPFMLVAGDHARNDMAGDEPDSWKCVLQAEGFEVTCQIEGMGSWDAVADMYLKHLQKTEKAETDNK